MTQLGLARGSCGVSQILGTLVIDSGERDRAYIGAAVGKEEKDRSRTEKI